MNYPFKVGDKVKVISEKQSKINAQYNPGFIDDMTKFCSKVVTIDRISINKDLRKDKASFNFVISIKEDYGNNTWCERYFESALKHKLSLE